MNREQSTKKGSTKNKPSKAEVENLALMLAGVIAHPAIPPALRQHIREGVTELFNGLGHHPDAQNNVTDSPRISSFFSCSTPRGRKEARRNDQASNQARARRVQSRAARNRALRRTGRVRRGEGAGLSLLHGA